jgi:hypothetical protein
MRYVVHCKKSPYDVYIGRPSKWENPYSFQPSSIAKFHVETREESVKKFEEYFFANKKLLEDCKRELKNKILGCYCFPETPCHGDILAKYANQETNMKDTLYITPELITKCWKFAEASVQSSRDKYASRGQNNVEKLKIDIMTGKIGEEVVYQELSKQFPELTAPDHNVYDKSNKNWDADLKDKKSEIKIAIKSQSSESAQSYDDSWIFQAGIFDKDKEVFDKTDNNHYVAFVSVNTPRKTATIRAIVKIDWLKENKLFKPLKFEGLQNNKLAVYFDDLLKF